MKGGVGDGGGVGRTGRHTACAAAVCEKCYDLCDLRENGCKRRRRRRQGEIENDNEFSKKHVAAGTMGRGVFARRFVWPRPHEIVGETFANTKRRTPELDILKLINFHLLGTHMGI